MNSTTKEKLHYAMIFRFHDCILNAMKWFRNFTQCPQPHFTVIGTLLFVLFIYIHSVLINTHGVLFYTDGVLFYTYGVLIGTHVY